MTIYKLIEMSKCQIMFIFNLKKKTDCNFNNKSSQ